MKSLFKILTILSSYIFIIIPMTTLASDCFNYKFTSAQVADMFRYGDTETSLLRDDYNCPFLYIVWMILILTSMSHCATMRKGSNLANIPDM